MPPPSAPPSRPPLRSFDRIARPYRWLERLSFGPALARTREHFLPQLRCCRRALILGDGDGRFLAALLRANPRLQATAVDGSATMLSLLSARCRFAAGRLQTVHADLLAALPPPGATPSPTPPGPCDGPFDLVITHFVLDCFTPAQLAQLLPAVRSRLAPGALWVLSEFRIPPRGPARLAGRLLVRSLYLAFGLLTGLPVRHLPPFAAALAATGLLRQHRHLRLAGLLTSELWQLPASNSEDPSVGGPPMKPHHAPIETVYDIDPLTPVPRPPNPLPAELERDLLEQQAHEPASPAQQPANAGTPE